MKAAPIDLVVLNDQAAVTGGSSAVAIASAREMAARGHRVTFLAGVGPVAPALRNVPNLEVVCLDGREIAADPNRWRAFATGIRNSTAVDAVREVLSRCRAGSTLVHVHSWTKSLSPFAVAAAEESGCPVVVTLHDYFIACPNGGFFVHGQNQLCERVPLSRACWGCRCDRRNYAQKLWRAGRTVVQNRVLRVPARVARFVAVSRFSLDRLRPYLPAEVAASVVRNPIDAPAGGAVDVAANRAFVFVGRLEPEKGALLAAQAAAAAGLPATFVGDGPLRDAIRRACPAARFTGWLDAEEVRRELRRARCLVFPPLWHETLGLVVVEAAALGVPAIVADRSAATDMVTDGVNGRTFEHGSVPALAEVMQEFAANSAMTARLGRAAFDWYWDEPWTSQRHGDELAVVYDEVLTAWSRRENGGNRHADVDRIGAGSGRSLSLRGDAVPASDGARR
ncbi:MAG TPA: glycosyltransferase [Opitutaceae bacterium]|nr:glycosyltransferase [Opitutaceae bacterium]